PPLYDRSTGPSEVMRREAAFIAPTAPDPIAQRLFMAEKVYSVTAILFWAPMLLWAVIQTVRSGRVRHFLPLSVVLVLSVAPVIFLKNKMMPHNLYLA